MKRNTPTFNIKAKKKIPVEIRINPLTLKGEKYALGIFRDITERVEAEKKLRESREIYKSLVDYSPDGVIIHIDGKIIFTNPTTLKMVGAKDEKEILGKSLFDFVLPSYHDFLKDRIKTLKKGRQTDVPFAEMKIKRPDGVIMTVETKGILFAYEKEIAILVVMHDLTTRKQLEKERLRSKIAEETTLQLQKEIKQKIEAEEKIHQSEVKLIQSLKEKEVLLKELHHRVKNNLQVISSIFNLQSSYIKDQKALEVLRESQNRIKSMSFIHEILYQSKEMSSINISRYINDLSKNLLHSYRISDDNIELKLNIEKVDFDLDVAIPCGLIVNELVSNSLKYAFVDTKKGRVGIELKTEGNKIALIISDNGVGFPKGLTYKNSDSLGLKLVTSLVEQLRGKIKVDNTSGTKYLITFNKN